MKKRLSRKVIASILAVVITFTSVGINNFMHATELSQNNNQTTEESSENTVSGNDINLGNNVSEGDISMPTLEIDTTSVCSECFGNVTTNGLCMDCNLSTNECECEEKDLNEENHLTFLAWDKKYLDDDIFKILEYDDEWFNSLKPVAKEHAKFWYDHVTNTALSDKYAGSSIANIVEYIDNGTLDYYDFYKDAAESKFSYDQLVELSKYNFTLQDIVDFYWSFKYPLYASDLFNTYMDDPEYYDEGTDKLYEIVCSILEAESYTPASMYSMATLADDQPQRIVSVASRGRRIGYKPYLTYAKTIDDEHAFCATHNANFVSGEYVLCRIEEDSRVGGIVSAVYREASRSINVVAYAGQLAIWTELGQCTEADAKIAIEGYFYDDSPMLYFDCMALYDSLMKDDLVGTAYYYCRLDGANYQEIVTGYYNGDTPDDPPPPDPTPEITPPEATITINTVEKSAYNSYTAEINKTSIITNEKLEGVVYEIEEVLVDDAGADYSHEGDHTWVKTTDENGYISVTSEHSTTYSAEYYEIDDQDGTAAITPEQLEWMNSYDGFLSREEAEEYVDGEVEKFESMTYEFIFTEKDSYERNVSSEDQNGLTLEKINLPKFGFRKGITSIDNTNQYSNVTRVDLTTESVLSTGELSNGDTGTVDMTNQPWRNQFFINKTDLETNNQIVYDTKFDIYEWNGFDWGQGNYEVVRITENIVQTMNWDNSVVGMYTVHRKQAEDAYTGTTFSGHKEYGTLYFTTINEGKFKIVETKAPFDNPTGYVGNFSVRPYTKLNGITEKIANIENDIAITKIEHEIVLCKDTEQYANYMLVDGYKEYTDNVYLSDEGYDSTSKTYTDSTYGITNGGNKLYYTGKYTNTKLNYNSYDANASVLNNRTGFNNTNFVQVEMPVLDKEYAFINERTYGFIRLTKFDAEAERYIENDLDSNYVDGSHHGDSDLNGAIYSLYVDNSTANYNASQVSNGGIKHPDGKIIKDEYHNENGIAILKEQQVFVDTDGDGYCDTWQVHDVALTPGTKVASATMQNGELEFDGLYLGNYYIVEEVRATENITSVNSDNIPHYEIRKLSFAPGYLVETDENNVPVKHYYQLPYIDETNYVIKDTDNFSSQQVVKGGFQLIKFTSDETVGSGYTQPDALSGAGFTIYQISELTKIKNGEIQPTYTLEQGHEMVSNGEMVKRNDSVGQFIGYELVDYSSLENKEANRIIFVPGYGYYFQKDILNAYLNKNYSNFEQKWAFENETQAIARVYENDTSYVTKTNSTLIHIPNSVGPNGTDSPYFGQNGISDGMVGSKFVVSKYPYANNTLNDRTNAQTDKEYVISEIFTNTWGEIKTPLLAWGNYLVVETTVPADKFTVDPFFVTISDTSPTIDRTKSYYELDTSMTQQLILVKRDAQTGQDVLLSNVKFRIWSYDDNKYISVMTQDTSSVIKETTVFETGNDGRVLFPGLSNLEVGKYRIEEISAPKGYYNEYWDKGNTNENPGFDKETLGGIGTDNNVPNDENMEQAYLGSVDFEITSDRLFQSSGLVSDNNLDMLYIGEYYYNYETLGMITITKTGEVLVGYENTDDIEYSDEYTGKDDVNFNYNKTYKNRVDFNANVSKFDIGTDTTVSGESNGAAYTDVDTQQNYNYDDNTYDFVYEERPLAGATFQIIASEDIYTPDNQKNSDDSRTTWFKKGDIVATVTTANDGEIVEFVPNYNKGGSYKYELTKNNYTGIKEYTSAEFATSGVIENKWIESRMSELDKAIYGVPEFSDEYIYPNSYYNEKGEQQVVVKVIKDGTLGEVSILLPLGKYTIKEITAPYGFILSEADNTSYSTKELTINLEYADQVKEVVFNTNPNSISDTKSKIDSFVDRKLTWWSGGFDTTGDEVTSRIGTYTDRFIGKAETVYYTDQEGFVNFKNRRIKPEGVRIPDDEPKYLSIGIYKEDIKTGELLSGAKYGLYSKDDIYNVDGKLLVEADTLLAVATTDENGHAEFEVDVPYQSQHYGSNINNNELLYRKNSTNINVSMDGNTSINSGAYYVKELTPPEGYLLDETPQEVIFDYKNQNSLYIPAYAIHRNNASEIYISKRDITNEEEIVGATLSVYEITKVVYDEVTGAVDFDKSELSDAIETWVSDGTTHTIRGLKLSNLEFPRLNNEDVREHVYVLREEIPADGYVTATDIVFEIVQDYEVDNNGNITWLQSNTVWVNNETTVKYVDGVIKAQDKYTDHNGEDKYNYNHDFYEYTNDASHKTELISDGCAIGTQTADIIANWLIINDTLLFDLETDATDAAIEKAINAKRLALAIENSGVDTKSIKQIYFTTEKVEQLFISDGTTDGDDDFTNPFNEEMIIDVLPDEILELLDADLLNGENPTLKVLQTFDWVKVNNAYNDIQNVATVDNGAKYFDQKPAVSLQRTIVMEDERTKLWINKADITSGEEVVGATLSIINKDGEVVETWVSDGTGKYIELLPIGEYILKEESAPNENGYVHTEDVKFTIEDDGYINSVYMPDNYTRIKITKTDIVTGKEVIGAHLTILDKDGNIVDSWETTNEPHYIEYLPTGIYTLKEMLVPLKDGYVQSNEIEFEIKDEDVVTKVDMKDDFTVVEISKTDIVTGKEIEGAHLAIYPYVIVTETIKHEEIIDENGNIIPEWEEIIEKEELSDEAMYEWISGQDGKNADGTIKPHYIEKIPVGKYALVETQAPDGYLVSDSIDFEVINKLYHYEDDNKTIKRDSNGNVIYNETDIIKVKMEDDFTKLNISKVDITNQEEIEGATLELYSAQKDINGNYIYEQKIVNGKTVSVLIKDKLYDSWVSGSDGKNEDGTINPHYIERIPVGKYILVETQAPDGYIITSDVEFEVKATGEIQSVVMEDERGLLISKQNITTKKEISGAKLEIWSTKVNEKYEEVADKLIISWTSDKNAPYGINIDLLELDKIYILHEAEAPEGYFLANDIKFSLSLEDGQKIPTVYVYDIVTKKYVPAKDHTITMYDDCTSVNIHKYKEGSKKFLPGAKLHIEDTKGNIVIPQFITGSSFTNILGLPFGTYYLVEDEAPKGYEIARKVKFEVTESNSTANPVIVEMYDVRIEPDREDDEPENSTDEPNEVITYQPPQTGDDNNILPFVIGGISLIVLLGIMIIILKKKKE